ncbi:MAG: hypothetical protein ABI785_07800 [Gemmatimonadales bacterium]
MIRDLKGTTEREGTEIGLFITLKDAKPDAARGFHRRRLHLPHLGQGLPAHPDPDHPPAPRRARKADAALLLMPTYQQAERIPAKQAAEQKELFG